MLLILRNMRLLLSLHDDMELLVDLIGCPEVVLCVLAHLDTLLI